MIYAVIYKHKVIDAFKADKGHGYTEINLDVADPDMRESYLELFKLLKKQAAA